MSKTTTFVPNVSANGVNNLSYGRYLWSDPANWTNGIPTDGDTAVVATPSYDDLASIHLANLTLQDNGSTAGLLRVTDGNLVIDQLKSDFGTSLTSDGFLGVSNQGHPVVTINSIVAGSGGILNAVGTGSVLDIKDADSGHVYGIIGARLDLYQPISAYSSVHFSGPPGTLALYNAPPVIAAQILAYDGDTIELPGAKVLDVKFNNSRLTSVTTDTGTFQFTRLNQYLITPSLQTFGAYSMTHDAVTGLEAITLLAPEVFSSTGPSLAWSNAANWSAGVPLNGDVVTASAAGVDDLASLDLSMLSDSSSLTVAGGSLSIGSYDLGGTLVADASGGQPASVKIDTTASAITAAGGSFGATGAAARFEDDSTTDRRGTYVATNGGRIDLYAAPAANSALTFAGTADTIALHGPAGVVAAALTIGAGDTIELTGTTVSGVVIGANSLAIMTDNGTTTFSNVDYRSTAASFAVSRTRPAGWRPSSSWAPRRSPPLRPGRCTRSPVPWPSIRAVRSMRRRCRRCS